MNRYLNQFNRAFTGGLMAFGVLLIASKAAMAVVLFLGVDRQAELINNDTTAIVTGAVACDVGQMYNVSAVVVQNQGALLANVIGAGQLRPILDFLDCTGSPIPFAVPVQVLIPASGTFVEGQAEVSVSALATDATGSDTQTVNTKIQLSN